MTITHTETLMPTQVGQTLALFLVMPQPAQTTIVRPAATSPTVAANVALLPRCRRGRRCRRDRPQCRHPRSPRRSRRSRRRRRRAAP